LRLGWRHAALAAVVLLAAPSAQGQDLVPLYQALAAMQGGRASEPVSIIQLGDSHSAGDYFSGRMRELFQEHFGAAGRGMLPPGIADPYFDPRLVRVAASPGWTRVNARAPDAAGPFGLAGVRQDASRGGAILALTDLEPPGFDRAFVELWRHPRGGNVRLGVDTMPARAISTDGPPGAGWVELTVPPHSHTLTLETTGGGGVEVLSWGTERRARGVLYQNFGVIGATVGVLARADPAIVAGELAHLRPALIVVMFGTNEAFGNPADLLDYQAVFAASVRALTRAAPRAGVLVVGPPDVNREYPAGAAAGQVCGPAQGDSQVAKPAMVWARPRALDQVIADQRAMSQRFDWAFWDWSAAMGGNCAMYRWAGRAEPLGRPDHVHFQAAGYQLSAETLFQNLMAGYAGYLAAHARR
jgi:lysophospholipase L1-like esterase